MLSLLQYTPYDKITTTHSIPNIPWTKLSNMLFRRPTKDNRKNTTNRIRSINL